jgi:hypothetical protein
MNEYIAQLQSRGVKVKRVESPAFLISDEAFTVQNMPYKSIEDAANELSGKHLVVFQVLELPVENTKDMMVLIRGKTLDEGQFNGVQSFGGWQTNKEFLEGINQTEGVPSRKGE